MAGRADIADRRRSKRSGREKGCWTYIPEEELIRAGITPDGPPPEYTMWPGRKRTIMVQLYEAKA